MHRLEIGSNGLPPVRDFPIELVFCFAPGKRPGGLKAVPSRLDPRRIHNLISPSLGEGSGAGVLVSCSVPLPTLVKIEVEFLDGPKFQQTIILKKMKPMSSCDPIS